MFSVYYVSSHSDVTRTISYGLQHTCSVYFPADFDHERDERTFVVFAGASVRPELREYGLNYHAAALECANSC